MRRLKLTALVLAMPLLTLGMAERASAVPSQVTITEATRSASGVDVSGRVGSSKRACKKNRRVQVYHDVDPEGPGANDFPLGETFTNRRGGWRLSSIYQPDKVYARVLRKNRRGLRCGADTSDTTPVTTAP